MHLYASTAPHCICTPCCTGVLCRLFKYLLTYLQALQDDATVSDLEELSLKLNAVEVAHYKALEAATPEPKSSESNTAMQEGGAHGVSD